MKQKSIAVVRTFLTPFAAFAAALAVHAQEAREGGDGAIEEVIVTAQRIVENVQQVPIAVTALSASALEDQQIINPSDLQLNAPNVSFTATNFGGSSFSIRGIGNLVIGRTGESGVSMHLNEIAVPTNLNSIEFFDMERVEVLRGPQGTLFGRNATGGAINFVTKKPDAERIDGFVDVELGDYAHQRVKGAINLPLWPDAALRVAGYRLNRDGYIENLAHGQTDRDGNTLPGIDDDIDGRNILALRATLAWDFTDRARGWLLYSLFDEDDDRARITNQVCVRNPIPTTGCLPNEFGWQTPHLGATTAGIFAGLAGALPLGADGASPALYDYARPSISGFRQMHTDFEPIFNDNEKIWAFGAEYDFDSLQLSLIGARRYNEYLSQQDYAMDVGASLGPTPGNPSGAWPVSAPAGGAGAEWLSETCNLNAGTSGVPGGCILGVHQNRAFAYDQLDAKARSWTVEAKLNSTFDGPFDFLLGVSKGRSENYGGYYVLANTLDLATVAPPAVFPAPLYPGFFYNSNDPAGGAQSESWAAFGEVYFDLDERLTLTSGLRINSDKKRTSDSSALLNAADVNAAIGGILGADPIWLRSGLFGEMAAMAANPTLQLSDASTRLLQFHNAAAVYGENAPAAIGLLTAAGAAQEIGASIQSGALPPAFVPAFVATLPLPPVLQATVLALLSGNPATIATDRGVAAGALAFSEIVQAVPPVPGFGETRFLTGSPSEASWRELSGRVGLDFQLTDDVLLYGFYSRGYKPGGFNPAIPPAFQSTSAFTFDAEQVSAFEGGVKSLLLDGRLMANASVFVYDYSGLQVTRIRNNSSINDNVDANLVGLEVEGRWRPAAMPSVTVDFSYGWLSSEVDGSQSLDPVNRTAGNPDYILLNNIDPGSLTGVNYVAREAQITAGLIAAAGAVNAIIPVAYPANSAGVAIPAYFSRRFLDAAGVETSDGLLVNLDGNELPNAPSHTLKLGAAHTWTLSQGGTLTARWDWYWQSESYAREFNTVGDEIDAWSQHNATAIYEKDRWQVRAWVRNILNDDNVTGKYLTSDTSGFFRNYFLTEPRIYGVSFRYGFAD